MWIDCCIENIQLIPIVKREEDFLNIPPVFVFDDSIYNFPHLLCEGRRIGGKFLYRWSPPFSLPLPILIFVPSSTAPT